MSEHTTARESGTSGPGYSLINYTINTVIDSQAFDPNRLLSCLGEEDVSYEDPEQPGRWYADTRVVNPRALVRLIVERHEDSENLHYHVLILVDVFTSPERVEEPLSWNRVLECLGKTYPARLQCSLVARAEFAAERWETVLALPRAASGLVPEVRDGEIMLSGIELDFSKTSLPLDGLFLSSGDEEYYVAVRYQRTLELQKISGLELLSEAEELVKTFVIERTVGGGSETVS